VNFIRFASLAAGTRASLRREQAGRREKQFTLRANPAHASRQAGFSEFMIAGDESRPSCHNRSPKK
jgi:hypothetical protein